MGVTSFFLCTFAPVMKNRLLYTFLLPFLVLIGLAAMMFLPELEIAGYTLKPVNLLSDVGVSSSKLHSPLMDEEPLMLDTIPEIKPAFQEEHPKGMTIIEDFSRQEGDSVFFVGRGMDHFYEMLGKSRELARPVRIAYFGDSFIEGDILTDQLRADLQSEFGGEGVGFIDMASPTAGFRRSVRAYSKGWYAHSITDSVRFDRSRQGLAERFYVPIGRAYTNVNGIPNNKSKHQDTCSVSNVYFRSPEGMSVSVRINGGETQTFESLATEEVQALGVRGKIGRVTWSVVGDTIDRGNTFFGVSMDGENGVALDNFSLRGSSGVTLRTIPDHTLEEFAKVRAYDLIVLQFGLNVANSRRGNYAEYERKMREVVMKLAKAYPEASILIVSVSDRGQKVDGQVTTMYGIEQLAKYQRQLAYRTGCAYWNLFEAMGGKGSMAVFADSIPVRANKDYTHLNFAGGRYLGHLLFETLVDGWKNYEKRKAYEMEP